MCEFLIIFIIYFKSHRFYVCFACFWLWVVLCLFSFHNQLNISMANMVTLCRPCVCRHSWITIIPLCFRHLAHWVKNMRKFKFHSILSYALPPFMSWLRLYYKQKIPNTGFFTYMDRIECGYELKLKCVVAFQLPLQQSAQ